MNDKANDSFIKDSHRLVEKMQLYAEKYPENIPNSVCNHAILSGILISIENKPKLHTYMPFFKTENESVFLWKHSKDRDSSLVVEVNLNVIHLPVWKNIGYILFLAFQYHRRFETVIFEDEIMYFWSYYFDSNSELTELKTLVHDDSDILKISSGELMYPNRFREISPIIELLLRDDVAFTSLTQLSSSLRIHYCCLICELSNREQKMHPSHEPEVWEQINEIASMEPAIVQACRSVESILGHPPNRERQNSYNRHLNKWKTLLGIDPNEIFQKANTSYVDFYYHLFQLRNSSAHSFGNLRFELERKATIEVQCFAAEIVFSYFHVNLKSEKEATEIVKFNPDIA